MTKLSFQQAEEGEMLQIFIVKYEPIHYLVLLKGYQELDEHTWMVLRANSESEF